MKLNYPRRLRDTLILRFAPDFLLRRIRQRRAERCRYRIALREGCQLHNTLSKP